MNNSEVPSKKTTRAQFILLFLVLTAAIATGLALFSSASTVIAMFKQATSGLFLPILLSMIVAFLLEPPVRSLERLNVNRTASIFIVFFLVATALFLSINWLVPHWSGMWDSLKSDIPRYTGRLVDFLKDLQTNLQNRFPVLETYDLPTKAREIVEQIVAYVLVQTPKSALRLGSLMIMVPLFSFFFLRDGGRILRSFISLAPNRYFEMTHDLSYLVNHQMAHFVRGRILEAFIIGLVVSVGLSFTDIPYVPILGFFAGITNLIPYIGPVVGMVPGILIALVDLGMGGQFWWVVTVYILISQVLVDNFILIPILISRVSNLHPLLVIFAIIMGGQLYGVLGMIIGVPVASIINIAIQETRHYRNAFSLPEAPPESEHLS